MMPRFHLYGDFTTWKDNIQQHEEGLWARWKDVQPYIEHCHQLGLNFDPPAPDTEEPESYVQKRPVVINEDDIELDDEEDDLNIFDSVTKDHD